MKHPDYCILAKRLNTTVSSDHSVVIGRRSVYSFWPLTSACCSWSSFQALYSYAPQNEDELELQEGDLVSVMEKCDDGWFVGMCRGPFAHIPQRCSHTLVCRNPSRTGFL